MNKNMRMVKRRQGSKGKQLKWHRKLIVWWRKNRHKGAGLSKGKREVFAVFIWFFLVTLPYNVYYLRAAVTCLELYHHSNFSYRLGQWISPKELEDKFLSDDGDCVRWRWYWLKEKEDVISEMGVRGYPIPSWPIMQRVVLIVPYDEKYIVYGIKNGMDVEEANSILKKYGYRYFEEKSFNFEGRECRERIYCKGGITIKIDEKDGRVDGIEFKLRYFWEYVLKRGGSFLED